MRATPCKSANRATILEHNLFQANAQYQQKWSAEPPESRSCQRKKSSLYALRPLLCIRLDKLPSLKVATSPLEMTDIKFILLFYGGWRSVEGHFALRILDRKVFPSEEHKFLTKFASRQNSVNLQLKLPCEKNSANYQFRITHCA